MTKNLNLLNLPTQFSGEIGIYLVMYTICLKFKKFFSVKFKAKKISFQMITDGGRIITHYTLIFLTGKKKISIASKINYFSPNFILDASLLLCSRPLPILINLSIAQSLRPLQLTSKSNHCHSLHSRQVSRIMEVRNFSFEY